jgi:hypothetical protein
MIHLKKVHPFMIYKGEITHWKSRVDTQLTEYYSDKKTVLIIVLSQEKLMKSPKKSGGQKFCWWNKMEKVIEMKSCISVSQSYLTNCRE